MPKQVIQKEEFEAQQAAPSVQTPAPAAGDEARKEYKPSPWVTKRITEIPAKVKEEVKLIYNLDLNDMLEHPENYGFGLMSFVASNNATLTPTTLFVDEKMLMAKRMADKCSISLEEASKRLDWVPNMGKKQLDCTFRFWHIPGSNKWGIETFEVQRRYAVDPEGEYMKKGDGADKTTLWNPKELTEGDVIRFAGTMLSKDQSDHLRLTGTLGETLMRKSFKGEDVPVCLYLDVYSGQAIHRLLSDVESQFNHKMGSGNTFELGGAKYTLDASAKKAAASGAYVWAKGVDDPSVRVNVWYDPRTNMFRPTIASNPHIDYSEARRMEINENKKKAKAKKDAKGQEKGQAKAKKGKG